MTVFTKREICVYIFILKDSDIGMILSFLWELGSLSIILRYIFISELKNKQSLMLFSVVVCPH